MAAFVLLKEGAELTKETLLASIRERIAHFKLPKKIIFVDEFPRNSVGNTISKSKEELLLPVVPNLIK